MLFVLNCVCSIAMGQLNKDIHMYPDISHIGYCPANPHIICTINEGGVPSHSMYCPCVQMHRKSKGDTRKDSVNMEEDPLQSQ